MAVIPWHHIGPTSKGDNAFHHEYEENGINHFKAANLDWCTRCKMVVDCDTHSYHEDGIYVFKKNCKRCGKITAWGKYSVPLVHCGTPLPNKVHVFFLEEDGTPLRTLGGMYV